jgi:HAD superfamily hydrolase (TIGR01509 family)
MAASENPCHRRQFVPWAGIDTVLLDMDGTLLDLKFDNYFWLQAVPERYARDRGLTFERACEILRPMFAAKEGTLEWYCTDYWSRQLEFDIAALKHELRERVSYLPGAERFLRTLKESGLTTVLVTNAHRDSLRVKASQTGLLDYLTAAISSHRYGAPKEDPKFWISLQAELGFDCERTLFVDDSLAVLRAARRHGVRHVVAITHPDSTLERRIVAEFPSVHAVVELLALSRIPTEPGEVLGT